MAVRTVFHLELTDRCNFHCSFCRSVRKTSNAMMDYDTAIKCLDAMKDRTIYGEYLNSVQFNGNGEALLYPRLDEVIIEARKRFSMAEIVTNASLLTEERVEKLLNTDIDMIEISLTGIIPEVYQHFQGSGIPYEKCVRQLETVIFNVHTLLRKRNEMGKHTYIRLRYIKSRELGSYQHFKDYLKYWKDSGVDEIFVTSLWNFRRNSNTPSHKKFKIIRCVFMKNPVKINANGDVFSCTCNLDLKRYGHGNVYEMPLEQIITSEAFLEERANKMTADLNCVPKTCLSCENRAYRNIFEEIMNRRQRIIFGKPIKSFFYRFWGIMVILYERLNRFELCHRFSWAYLCKQSKKIHDMFQQDQIRAAGEHR